MAISNGRGPREPDDPRTRSTSDQESSESGKQSGPPQLRVVPGKTTLTSKLEPRPGPIRGPLAPGARPALSAHRSLAELTDDPWMDAAHRGSVAFTERGRDPGHSGAVTPGEPAAAGPVQREEAVDTSVPGPGQPARACAPDAGRRGHQGRGRFRTGVHERAPGVPRRPAGAVLGGAARRGRDRAHLGRVRTARPRRRESAPRALGPEQGSRGRAGRAPRGRGHRGEVPRRRVPARA